MGECCLTKLKNLRDQLKSRIPPNLSVPDIIQYFHVFLAGLAISIGFIVAIVDTCNGRRTWQVALAVLGGWAVILGVVFGVKKFLKNLHTSHRTVTVAQSKNKLLLGFLGVMVFGFLPRIYVICDPYDYEYKQFFVFISLPTISLIYKLFIAKAKKNYRITYEKSDVLPWLIFAGNYIAFYFSMSLDYHRNHWVQGLFAPICTAAMIEFGQVLRDKVVSVHGIELENKSKSQKTEEKKPLQIYKDQVLGLQIEGKSEDLAFIY